MQKMLRYITLLGCVLATGCSMLPEIAHQPILHNPYPQLSKVAIAPFFNLSDEPTLDGRRVALAYYNELQLVPGYEVVPVEVVEQKIQEHQIALHGPADARLLAQILGVDAVVVGAVTDYCPYYPPRCGLQVEWYAANPNFHPIPAGYGLPWGGPEERDIPAPLVFEAEFALAKAQLKTQTPPYEKIPSRRASAAQPAGGRGAAGKPASGSAAPGTCRHGPRDSTGLARRPRLHPAAAKLCPAAALPNRFAGDAAHADLQRARHGIHRGVVQLLFLPRRRPKWGVAKLSPAERRLSPVLLPHAHQRNAQRPGRSRRNASGVALADNPINI